MVFSKVRYALWAGLAFFCAYVCEGFGFVADFAAGVGNWSLDRAIAVRLSTFGNPWR